MYGFDAQRVTREASFPLKTVGIRKNVRDIIFENKLASSPMEIYISIDEKNHYENGGGI